MSTTPSPSERTSAVGQFFLGKGLPWTAAIESGLAEFEVKCVEHLKLLEDDEWDGLFIGCSVIVQRLASKVFAAVKDSGDVDPNKCAQEMGISANVITPVASQKRPSSSSNTAHKLKNDGSYKPMQSFFKVTKSITADDAKRQRLARKAEKEAEMLALAGLDGNVERTAAEVERPTPADYGADDTLAKISKHWDRSGKQQAASTHVLCAKAFDAGYTNPEIALEIRRYAFRREHFDETKKSEDKRYRALVKTIRRYRGEHHRNELLPLLELKGKDRAKAMRAKSVGKTGRGRKPTVELCKVEQDLNAWIRQLNAEERRVTSTMIFRKVMELDPKFKGGVESEGHLKRLKQWFYYGFSNRANLSVRKLASVGQKLPPNWQARMEDLRGRIRARQNPRRQGDGTIRLEGVRDKHYVNTDHVPVWVESVGNTSWGPKDSGRRTVKTGGKEKNRFTVQLSITKDGDKLMPFLIFKGAEAPAGKKCGGRNTLTYEIMHRNPDADGNPYPTREECYITVTKTANSNRDLTKLILKKVILPGCGATSSDSEKQLADTSDHDIGVLWDDFKSHSTPEVKEFCQSRASFLKVDIMGGGLTPKGQPLDVVINKVYKAFFRDFYDSYVLTAPIHNGGPKPPSRQLLATWAVKAWKKVPRELVKKAWTACGYPSEAELGDPNVSTIVPYSPLQLSGLVEEICDEDIRGAFDRVEEDANPFFPEDDDDEVGHEIGDIGAA